MRCTLQYTAIGKLQQQMVATALRPQGFAIPENFTDQPPTAYQRAKFGPFRNINEDY